MAKTMKCEMCGAKAHRMIEKEFDGRVMSFCCRSCVDVYQIMRAEGLVQTESEDLFFTMARRKNVPLKSAGQAGMRLPKSP